MFLTGGSEIDGEAMKEFLRFDITAGCWTVMPQMQIARRAHGSCYLKGNIYVISGYSRANKDTKACLIAVEKLHVGFDNNVQKDKNGEEKTADEVKETKTPLEASRELAPAERKQEAWQLIATAKDFTPRSCPVVSPLNEKEILITGGWLGNDDLNYVFVMDVESERIEKVAEGGPIKFRSSFCAGAMVTNNQAVAFVAGDDDNHHMIEYSRDSDSMTILRTVI